MGKLYPDLEYSQGTGEVLRDEKYDWKTKKLKNIAVSPHISHCSEKRKEVIESCGSRLEFAYDGNGKLKLARAFLCHHPLCPICKGRRSMKTFHELLQITELARAVQPNVQFLMLTLTVPNVSGKDLSKTISHMMKSYKRLFERAEVKKSVKGWFRSLEVTVSKKRGDYHPHFHCLLMVNGSYFTSRDYIKQARWLELWQEATRQPEITQVDVRKVRSNPKRKGTALEAAAAEVGKYSTKDQDYVENVAKDEYRASGEVIETLCHAFKNRRFTGYGGLLKEYRVQLGLAEKEDDLIHVGDDKDDDLFIPVGLRLFYWMGTQQNYISR